jgi:hypothetical protein
MSNVTNLNQFRKRKAKAEKELDKARVSKASRDLDGHKAEE